MNKKSIIPYWKKNFDAYGVDGELTAKYIKYGLKLVNNDVPIIFDFYHLCELLGRTRLYLASVINSNISHYRTFSIPKRRGGMRKISTPYPALMECQYWIYNNILSKICVHSSAHGFVTGRSIMTNASIHLNQEQMLKIDIKDFFPSIQINKVISFFKELGYTNYVSYYLAAICSCGDELPQGAPTSPMLSNIISKHLDYRLYKFSEYYKLNYTRYADDLAFSGFEIPFKFIEYISGILSEEGFCINEAKTVLSKDNKRKRILTGVSIVSDKMKVPRQYKHDLRKDVHFIIKYGLESHMKKKKIKNPYYLRSIIGKVNYCLCIEPENIYFKNALIELNGLIKL